MKTDSLAELIKERRGRLILGNHEFLPRQKPLVVLLIREGRPCLVPLPVFCATPIAPRQSPSGSGSKSARQGCPQRARCTAATLAGRRQSRRREIRFQTLPSAVARPRVTAGLELAGNRPVRAVVAPRESTCAPHPGPEAETAAGGGDTLRAPPSRASAEGEEQGDHDADGSHGIISSQRLKCFAPSAVKIASSPGRCQSSTVSRG